MILSEEKSAYFRYKNTATTILKEVSQEYQIDIPQIRWNNFANLLTDKYHVTINPYTHFTGNLNRIFAGSLLVDLNGSAIGYNASPSQKIGRQHFTIVHEGIHFIYDSKKGTIPQSFSDLVKNKNYSAEEQIEEDNADYVASLVMCNDEALVHAMKKRMSANEFATEFGMTPSAVWTRIYNYLLFDCSIPKKRAYTLAAAYTDGGTEERRNFVNILIAHFDSFITYMNRENAFSADTFHSLYNEWNVQPKTASHFHQFQNLVDDLYEINGKICPNCDTTFYGSQKFCRLCGYLLIDYNFIHKGATHMPHSLELNAQSICKICPNCKIENTAETVICQYCGAFLKNICTGVTPTKFRDLVLEPSVTFNVKDEWIYEFSRLDSYHAIIPGNLIFTNVMEHAHNYPHDELHLLPGYSRFCDQCGCVTSFYLQSLLPTVDSHGKIKEEDKLPF